MVKEHMRFHAWKAHLEDVPRCELFVEQRELHNRVVDVQPPHELCHHVELLHAKRDVVEARGHLPHDALTQLIFKLCAHFTIDFRVARLQRRLQLVIDDSLPLCALVVHARLARNAGARVRVDTRRRPLLQHVVGCVECGGGRAAPLLGGIALMRSRAVRHLRRQMCRRLRGVR